VDCGQPARSVPDGYNPGDQITRFVTDKVNDHVRGYPSRCVRVRTRPLERCDEKHSGRVPHRKWTSCPLLGQLDGKHPPQSAGSTRCARRPRIQQSIDLRQRDETKRHQRGEYSVFSNVTRAIRATGQDRCDRAAAHLGNCGDSALQGAV
jgi:hypothetical protein